MDLIYLDNNATTPLLPAVWEAMCPYATRTYGNPGSAHRAGRHARQALEDARERVAHCLNAQPDEVLFTSGATEANNLALFGLAGDPPGYLLASPIEHPSVTEPLRHLARSGFDLEFLPCDHLGLIKASDIAARLRPSTRLVSVMLVNNETGTREPIAELARSTDKVPFHCDAVQAVGRIPVDFHQLQVSVLTASAHKFHGPRGVGLLLVRHGVKLRPQLFGGHQEQGIRPGTEAVALAVGLAEALQLACRDMTQRLNHIQSLRQRFLAVLSAEGVSFTLNGPIEDGLPHTLNLSFPGLKADLLLMSLDLASVACSTGSACSSGSLLPSPVLQAMALSPERLGSAMRFSLSHLLTREEVEEAASRIGGVVQRLGQGKGTEV
jgi:cysteine desulfurase